MLNRNIAITITVHVSFIILLSFSQTSGREHDDDYVDPTDLFNFDPASVSMKSSKKSNTVNVDNDFFTKDKHDKCEQADTCAVPPRSRENDGGGERSEFNNENKEKKNAAGDKEYSKIKQSLEASMALSRQYVNKLVNLLESKVGTASSPVDINLRLKVSYHDIAKLRKFGQGGSDEIHDVYEILNSVVQFASESIQPESPFYWLEMKMGLSFEVLWHIVAIVVCILLIVILLSKMTVTINKLLLAAFTVSVIFNWIEMYQKHRAEQDKILMMEKLSDRCPKMDELSFFSKITTYLSLSFTFQDESCKEYFHAMMVSPLVKASPIEAVAVAVVKTVVTPLGIIGTGIKAFFVGLLKDLPGQYQIMVISILFIIVILLLFFRCGYYLRIFGLITLGPAENRHAIQGPAHFNQHHIENRENHRMQGALYQQQHALHNQLMGLDERQMINNVPPVTQRDGPRAVAGTGHLDNSGLTEHGNRQRQIHNIPSNVNQTDFEGTVAAPNVNSSTATEASRKEEKVTDSKQHKKENGDVCNSEVAPVVSSVVQISKTEMSDSKQQHKKENGDGSNLEAAPEVSSVVQINLIKTEVTDRGQIYMQESGDRFNLEAATDISSVAHAGLSKVEVTESGQIYMQEIGDGSNVGVTAVNGSVAHVSLRKSNLTDSGHKYVLERGANVVTTANISSEVQASLAKQDKQSRTSEMGTANELTDTAGTDNNLQECELEIEMTERIESMNTSRNS